MFRFSCLDLYNKETPLDETYINICILYVNLYNNETPLDASLPVGRGPLSLGAAEATLAETKLMILIHIVL